MHGQPVCLLKIPNRATQPVAHVECREAVPLASQSQNDVLQCCIYRLMHALAVVTQLLEFITMTAG